MNLTEQELQEIKALLRHLTPGGRKKAAEAAVKVQQAAATARRAARKKDMAKVAAKKKSQAAEYHRQVQAGTPGKVIKKKELHKLTYGRVNASVSYDEIVNIIQEMCGKKHGKKKKKAGKKALKENVLLRILQLAKKANVASGGMIARKMTQPAKKVAKKVIKKK